MPKDHNHPAKPVQLPLPLVVPCARCGAPTEVVAYFGRPICQRCLPEQYRDPQTQKRQG